MKQIYQTIAIGVVLFFHSCNSPKLGAENSEPKFSADWESLAMVNEEPEWFMDAKLGIYFHWGVYTVPAFGTEWYPRWMHFKDRIEFRYHVENYGHPSEFGYHDFVPMFTAEHFDPAEWAELFQKAGARFAGPVAEHHDGFSMWDSDITPWNAMDKGPKRDITGELAKELRKRDMKLITTFHHARNLQRFDTARYEHISVLNDLENSTSWASHYPYFEGMAPASDKPELKFLYGNIEEEQWLEEIWLGKINEVVDKYQPDIIWFDGWLDSIPESYRQRMAADYYNKAAARDQEVVIVRKQNDLPLNMSVDDHEKTRMNYIGKKFWMTDETISTGSWSFTKDLKVKSASEVLHVLIDITSKNGVLLLNVSPRSNGVIPESQKNVLLEIGAWLTEFGEAIYDTRTWYTFGEGPTKEPESNANNRDAFLKLRYSNKDVRYTRKHNAIYAIQMGQPVAGENLLLESFAGSVLPEALKITGVSLIGAETEVSWSIEEDGLKIKVPDVSFNEMANVYKIETNN
jgi:alpha-L-fucosidase